MFVNFDGEKSALVNSDHVLNVEYDHKSAVLTVHQTNGRDIVFQGISAESWKHLTVLLCMTK